MKNSCACGAITPYLDSKAKVMRYRIEWYDIQPHSTANVGMVSIRSNAIRVLEMCIPQLPKEAKVRFLTMLLGGRKVSF